MKNIISTNIQISRPLVLIIIFKDLLLWEKKDQRNENGSFIKCKLYKTIDGYRVLYLKDKSDETVKILLYFEFSTDSFSINFIYISIIFLLFWRLEILTVILIVVSYNSINFERILMKKGAITSGQMFVCLNPKYFCRQQGVTQGVAVIFRFDRYF